MEYKDLLQRVSRIDFIGDETRADSAIKAVLGMLTSRMPEKAARSFTAALPPELSFERLHRHQTSVTQLSLSQYYTELTMALKLRESEVPILVRTILRLLKQQLPEEAILPLKLALPPQWSLFIEDS